MVLSPNSRRHGRTAIEILVVLGIVGFAILLVLMGLPKGRESARLVGCQNNMMQIGKGLELYHQMHRHYPTVPLLSESVVDSPLKAMLDAFVIPDLTELKGPAKPPRPSHVTPKGNRVAGLACPSDMNAMNGTLVPFISYRANTGDDPNGRSGPFQPGRTTTSSEVEEADGLGYTASFSERLVGNGRDGYPSLENYATSPRAISGDGCPPALPDRWKGDAGLDWSRASWRSTLYNHRLAPNASPSCIAEDGQSALMGASSGHTNRVNVLMMDGSLRGITPSINPKLWQAHGTIGTPEAKR